jgi:hypothetical protein
MIILLLHIGIAISSIAVATLAVVSPSRRKLNVSYSLVGLTLASGTYLVISMHTSLLRVCMTGLMYLAAVAVMLAVAQRRLATVKIKNDQDF